MTESKSNKHHFHLEKYPVLRHFGERIFEHNLWHLNKYSVSGAVFWGLLCSFAILPVQSILAIVAALFFRVNLPISLAMTWVSNPFTVVPILYIAYMIGALFIPAQMIRIEDIQQVIQYFYAWASSGELTTLPISIQNFQMSTLLVGLAIEALVFSALVTMCVRALWGNRFLTKLFLSIYERIHKS